jgi:hypothetical protein
MAFLGLEQNTGMECNKVEIFSLIHVFQYFSCWLFSEQPHGYFLEKVLILPTLPSPRQSVTI